MLTSYRDIIDIPEQFKKYFNVDLNADCFLKIQPIGDRWNAIVKATNMFWKEIDLKDFKTFEFDTLIDTYNLYQWDIWLNAYYSIKYINEEEKARVRLVKGVASDTHTLREFKLPVEHEIASEFCSAYKKYFFTKERKNIFNVKKIFEGEINSIEDIKDIKFHKNLYMESWSYKKVKYAEFEQSFDTEDRILFYKTVDCNLARKLTLYHYYKNDLDISNGEHDIIHMCMERKISKIDSFAWKNLYMDSQIKALQMCGGCFDMTEDEYSVFFKDWMDRQIKLLEFGSTILENADKINEKLSMLSRGLIYCILNYSASQSIVNEILQNEVKEKAEQAIEILMELGSREHQLFPVGDTKELRLRSAENDILKYYAWAQAKVIAYNPKFGWNE